MNGAPLNFGIDEVSMLDINDLIDRDVRFNLVSGEDTEFMDLEEYLKNGDLRIAVHE
jgi:hypothetical protein